MLRLLVRFATLKVSVEELKYVPPKYQITDKVLTLIAEGEKMLCDIRHADLSPVSRGKLIDTATTENLHYFSSVLGTPITRGEAKRISVGKIPAGKEYKVVANYRSAMEYIRNVCNTGIGEFNYAEVMHLNKLLGAGVGDEWDLGRVRAPGDRISEGHELMPPKNIDALIVTKTLPMLINYLDKTTSVHPLIRGVILLSDLIQLYPFVYLNTATVFASFELFLNVKEVGADGLVPIWSIIAEETNTFMAFYKDVIATGKAIDTLLEMVVVGWHKAIENVRREAVKLSYNEEIKGRAKFLNLNHRQLSTLRHLQVHVKITRREYMSLFKVSTMTAYRDLTDMVDKKLLMINGHGRGVYYVLVTKA